jgi:hypothetical protein
LYPPSFDGLKPINLAFPFSSTSNHAMRWYGFILSGAGSGGMKRSLSVGG